MLQLCLQPSVDVRHIGGETGLAHPAHQSNCFGPGGLLERDHVTVQHSRCRSGTGCLLCEQDPFDPQSEPDAGQRRSADLFDQAVVPSAAPDRVLGGFERAGLILEGRARVVIEAAHQTWRHLVLDPRVV